MRLDPTYIPLLIGEARAVFGENVELWLFGSRADDAAKGGDIDLYVETEDDTQLLDQRLDYLLRLARILGEQRVDLVIHRRGRAHLAIHRIARKTGVRLA